MATLSWKKVTIFSLSAIFTIIGFLLIFGWKNFYESILYKELSLADANTFQYKYWMETPIDIDFEVYFFNWTNNAKFLTSKQLPKLEFEEVGPYVFTVRDRRANVIFNDNNTVSFNTIRTWKFVPEKTRGNLGDTITTVNPLAIAISNVVKKKHYIIQRAIHYFLKEKNVEFVMSKTVNQFLFEGVESELIDIALKLKIKGFEIPWNRFGFLYDRNNSETYEGNFTIWTGADDVRKTGIVTEWNQSPKSSVYEGECGRIDGSTGDVWNPIEDANAVSIFLADICSKLTLQRDGTHTSKGIEGNLYLSTDKLFDNGEKYKETACFSPGERLPSGVRNISQCQFNSPAFISLPHFNMADKSYQDSIGGMQPDAKKHMIYLVLEPNYGLPLEMEAAFQANLRMYKVDAISMFQNVKDTMVPMVWFRVKGGVTDDLAILVKLVIAGATVGNIFGYIILLVGTVLFIFGVMIQIYLTRKQNPLEI